MASQLVQYDYTARNAKGRVVTGRVRADSRAKVLDVIRGNDLSPIEIREVAEKEPFKLRLQMPKSFARVNSKDLAVMTRQLATMVSAGLPLVKSLAILSNQTEKPALMRALNEVRQDVQSGMTLSTSMERNQAVFPPILSSLIRAGESGGFLDKALNSLADNFEADAKLRSTVRASMSYPIAVLSMAFLGVAAMLIFVVPIFQQMFKNLGGQLPLPTQILVWLSPIATWATPIVVVIGFAISLWWRRHSHEEWLRKRVDPLKFRIPVFGKLNAKIAVTRFARNFANMIGAGVPILKAMSIMRETAGNWMVEDALSRIQESVRLGATVSAPMAQEKVFPNMVTQMIAVGEDTGSLQSMLNKVADFYDQEIETTTAQLTSLIEPLMIAVVGVIIGAIIISLYLPIFTIFNLIHS